MSLWLKRGKSFKVHVMDFKSKQNQMSQTITSLRIMTPNLGVSENTFVIFQYCNGHRYVTMLLKNNLYTAFKGLYGGQSSQKMPGVYL